MRTLLIAAPRSVLPSQEYVFDGRFIIPSLCFSFSCRGLVPQLWPNYTGPPVPPAEEVPCDTARLKCAYRAGCGLALQNYVLACRYGPIRSKKSY